MKVYQQLARLVDWNPTGEYLNSKKMLKQKHQKHQLKWNPLNLFHLQWIPFELMFLVFLF